MIVQTVLDRDGRETERWDGTVVMSLVCRSLPSRWTLGEFRLLNSLSTPREECTCQGSRCRRPITLHA